MNDMRSTARRLFDAGVQAADPVAAVTRHLDYLPAPALIVAVGKAARGMAQAALARFVADARAPVLYLDSYVPTGERASVLCLCCAGFGGRPIDWRGQGGLI